MAIEDELDEFFSGDASCVVEDHDKFKMKLQIGSEAFTYLTKAENLGDFVSALGGGGIAAAGVYTGFISSLGVLGHLGLAVGLVSNPVGWMILAGTGSAASVFAIKKLFKAAKKEVVVEMPKFINSPIDVLAISVLDIFMPVVLKIAHADGKFSDQERQRIESYFVKEWGLNVTYINKSMHKMIADLDAFQYEDPATMLKKIEKSGDIKYETTVCEILRIVEDIMKIDGVSKEEISEFKRLKASLKDN